METQFIKDDITAGYRTIKDGSKFNGYFSNPENSDRVIIEDGEVEETVDLMKKVVWKYLGDTKRIAQYLKGSNIQESCNNIWDFLYNHIQYRLDKKGLEQLRRPCRSWSERRDGIDCDCFSIFVSSILTNMGIPHKFRITMYEAGVYQHVYVIVPTGKQYITIDCVVSQFNYEKPFTQNKDFTMSMNGINVAVLSGVDDNVMDLLSGLESLGELSADATNRFLYEHLVRTRNIVSANPALISHVDYPPAFLEMLDYAIKNWHTPNRDTALENLARNEDEMNRMNGFDGSDDSEIDGLDDLYGFEDELNGKKAGKKGFFKKIGQAVKKGVTAIAKTAIRFNPVTVTARNGFLLAIKINLKKMGSKLKWAYATKEQAAAKGVSADAWQKSKNALAKIEKLFVDKLQGKKSALKNAVLKGKAGGINGIEDESVDGLGILPAAAIAAAIPVITSALKALVDSGAMKKSEAEGIETEVAAKTSEANASASETDMTDNTTADATAASKSGSSDASSGSGNGSDSSSDSDGGIMGFVKKQPLIAIGGAALGIWGLTKLLGGKKKANSGLSGYSKRKSKQSPNKGKGKSKKQTPKSIKLS